MFIALKNMLAAFAEACVSVIYIGHVMQTIL